MSSQTSLYDLLGVAPGSHPSEIRAAYYAAIKTCHPDVDASPGAPAFALKIIDAYRVLGDPQRREQYNERLRLDAAVCGDPDSIPPAAPNAPKARRPESTTPWASAQPAAAAEPQGTGDRAEPAAVMLHAEPAAAPRNAEHETRPKRGRRRGWLRATVAGLSFVASFALLVLVVSALKPLTERGIAATAAAQQPDAFVQTAASANVPGSPCLDLFSGLKGEKLYRECVKTRVRLHLRMMRLTPGAELEQDELQDAMAELRQAVGAGQVHMASTQGFIEESVATFADVKKTAKNEQVRRIAENYYYYYDCQALKHCAAQ